ncbi:MAG: hypothetical protein J2O48_02900 [Solirubrobacterales bacterium]|nr:hypothetical protein [Solirubrobacterales bacterium]
MSTTREPEDRSECTPCRGTGQVSSNKGGAAQTITCPWCGGTGRFQSERDAQDFAPVAETPAPDAQELAPAADA